MNEFKLKELLEIKNGRDYKHLSEGNIPVYGSGGLMKHVNESLYQGESILLPRKGTLTNIQYVNELFWTVDTIYYTIVDKNKTEPYYLYYYLKQLDLSHLNSGTGVPSMTFGSYNDIPIKLPNLQTQKQIAKVLSDLDAKIELNNKINQELEAMAKTLYGYWFVQFDFPNEQGKPYKSSGGKMVFNEELKREIPEGWEVKTISDWIENNKNGDWGKESEQGNYVVQVSCIRGADINGLNGKGVVKSPERFILEKNTHKLLEDGDLIIEISGGSPTQSTGRMAFITAETLDRFENPLICSNFCKAVTLEDKEYLFNFVYQWNRLYDAGVLFGWEGKTSGIKNLLFESFSTNYKTVYPKKEIVKKFHNIMLPIHQKKQKNLKQNQQLAKLRDWLLPMLMNGQVTVAQAEEKLGLVAEERSVYKTTPVFEMATIKPIDTKAAIIGTHIVKELENSPGMGRTKFQKVLHIVAYSLEKELGGIYYKNTAGPYNEILINHIENKFKQYGHINKSQDVINGHKHIVYKTTSKTKESEDAYKNMPKPFRDKLDSLIAVFSTLNLKESEAISTLYAIWNNRIIENLEVNNNLLMKDFYAWSERKRKEFIDKDIENALDIMKKYNLIPTGFGGYIDKQ